VADDGPPDRTGPFAVPPDEPTHEWSEAAERTGPVLVVRSHGNQPAQIFPLAQGRTAIGRAVDAEIFLDDVSVSRRHAVVLVAEDEVVLRDLGSLNGTYVNRRRIEDDEALVHGDEVQVGRFRLVFLG
jgi:pSer/pThr/pTyr-binding forkhead associated (FHA) protein